MVQRRDPGLDTLLDLAGERIVLDDGAWVKFEVRQVLATPERPHGIEYSLTYHDRHNRRILGFDNAHVCGQRAAAIGDGMWSTTTGTPTPRTKAGPITFNPPSNCSLIFGGQ